jgi:hypothetical protein
MIFQMLSDNFQIIFRSFSVLRRWNFIEIGCIGCQWSLSTASQHFDGLVIPRHPLLNDFYDIIRFCRNYLLITIFSRPQVFWRADGCNVIFPIFPFLSLYFLSFLYISFRFFIFPFLSKGFPRLLNIAFHCFRCTLFGKAEK